MCNHFATAPFVLIYSIRRLSNTFIYLCYLKTSKPRCTRRKGGADIFLDHSGSTYIIPKLSLYSTGLMPPKVILIRSSLYQ